MDKSQALTYELLDLFLTDLRLAQPAQVSNLIGRRFLREGNGYPCQRAPLWLQESDMTEKLTHSHTHKSILQVAEFFIVQVTLTLPDPKSSKVTKSLNITFILKQYKLVFFVCLFTQQKQKNVAASPRADFKKCFIFAGKRLDMPHQTEIYPF